MHKSPFFVIKNCEAKLRELIHLQIQPLSNVKVG